MANLLHLIIGVKKSAEEARKGKKKGGSLGFMGRNASSKAYEEAEEALAEHEAGFDGDEKK